MTELTSPTGDDGGASNHAGLHNKEDSRAMSDAPLDLRVRATSRPAEQTISGTPREHPVTAACMRKQQQLNGHIGHPWSTDVNNISIPIGVDFNIVKNQNLSNNNNYVDLLIDFNDERSMLNNLVVVDDCLPYNAKVVLGESNAKSCSSNSRNLDINQIACPAHVLAAGANTVYFETVSNACDVFQSGHSDPNKLEHKPDGHTPARNMMAAGSCLIDLRDARAEPRTWRPPSPRCPTTSPGRHETPLSPPERLPHSALPTPREKHCVPQKPPEVHANETVSAAQDDNVKVRSVHGT